MKPIMKTCLLLTLLLIFFSGRSYGQGWIRDYSGAIGNVHFFQSVTAADGGVVFVGIDYVNDYIKDIWVLKTDANGTVQWEKHYGAVGFSVESYGLALTATSDGGYAVTGYEEGFGAADGDVFLLKLDAFGDQEWYKMYVLPDSGSAGRVVREFPGGGYVIGAFDWEPLSDLEHLYLIRTDASGNALFTRDYYGFGQLGINDIIAGADNSMVLCGHVKTSTDGSGTSILGDTTGAFLMKMDASGNPVWATVIDSIWLGLGVEETPDGYIMTASKLDDILPSFSQATYIIRFDSLGNTLWTRKLTFDVGLSNSAIHANGDDTYMVTGDQWSTADAFLLKMDGAGNILWNQRGYPVYEITNALSLSGTPDGGYCIGGMWDYDRLVKTDSLGNITTNYISGRIFEDLNGNCVADAGERFIGDNTVEAAGLTTLYATTDSGGYYFMETDTGTFVVSTSMAYPYWVTPSCASNPDTVNAPLPYDTAVVDFPMEPIISCPGMQVSLTHTPIRCGFPATYSIQYCNLGSTGDSAVVVLELDTYMVADSCTIPWNLPQSGSTYVFEVGYLAPGNCGTFYLSITLACDSTVLVGQTHCVEAHIYPDTLCTPPSPFWDGASVKLTGACTASEDSVKFWIHNVGSNNMATPGNVIVLEDNIMRLNTNFDLGAGDSTLIAVPANGSTWSCKAAQRPSHPGDDHPMIAIEGCGVNGSGTFSTGFVNTLAQNDADPWIDIDCSQNVASFDPNGKEATPTGRLSPHYIQNTDQLEYTVHFQNTGTDTAFTVVVRDTLSSFLDIPSIVPGAASHPYTFRLYGYNIAEWTFDDILLPDSSTDLAGSQGVFEFTIHQQPGNPVGTEILNGVSIWFDFNAPVPTNVVLRTIGEDLWGMISVDPAKDQLANTVRAYPNPSSSSVWFEMTEPVKGRLHLQITDLSGRVVYSRDESAGAIPELKKGDLAKGMYLFRLSDDSGRVGTGRIVLY